MSSEFFSARLNPLAMTEGEKKRIFSSLGLVSQEVGKEEQKWMLMATPLFFPNFTSENFPSFGENPETEKTGLEEISFSEKSIHFSSPVSFSILRAK